MRVSYRDLQDNSPLPYSLSLSLSLSRSLSLSLWMWDISLLSLATGKSCCLIGSCGTFRVPCGSSLWPEQAAHEDMTQRTGRSWAFQGSVLCFHPAVCFSSKQQLCLGRLNKTSSTLTITSVCVWVCVCVCLCVCMCVCFCVSMSLVSVTLGKNDVVVRMHVSCLSVFVRVLVGLTMCSQCVCEY